MKEKLEDFVRQHRNAFDDKEPSYKNWTEISRSMGFKEKVAIWNSLILWKTAAMLFMGLSLYLLVSQAELPRQREGALKEFADVETFYIAQISEKTELIAATQRVEGLNGFTHDFKQLEAMYMVLKEEMKSSPSQKVKDALVLNLLVRIDLLNQQLHKLEQKEPESESKDQKRASSKSV
jgi:hypothetical protein